jgi:hypothetical protein
VADLLARTVARTVIFWPRRIDDAEVDPVAVQVVATGGCVGLIVGVRVGVAEGGAVVEVGVEVVPTGVDVRVGVAVLEAVGCVVPPLNDIVPWA